MDEHCRALQTFVNYERNDFYNIKSENDEGKKDERWKMKVEKKEYLQGPQP
jgi:hypothetical protein